MCVNASTVVILTWLSVRLFHNNLTDSQVNMIIIDTIKIRGITNKGIISGDMGII